jgi:hypothetical protein
VIAFELSINGERIATAGVGDTGVLLAIMRWVNSPSNDGTSVCDIEVCGHSHFPPDHSVWAEHSLVAGDEVLLRIIDTETADAPISTTPLRNFPHHGNDQRNP